MQAEPISYSKFELQELVQKMVALRDSISYLSRWNSHQQKWSTQQKLKQQSAYSGTIKVITLNVLKIHKQKLLFSTQRYAYIYKQIEELKPQVISLNEVTDTFYSGLEEQQYIRKNYWISALKKDPSQGLGNVILTSIKPIFSDSIIIKDLPRPIQAIFLPVIVRNNIKIICFCSIHLTAFAWNSKGRDYQFTGLNQYLKRYQAVIDGFVLMGDMNFHSEQQNKIYENHGISDGWLQVNDIKNDPGYTFDALQNAMINEIYWGFERRRMRLDRILLSQTSIMVQNIKIIMNQPIYAQKTKTNHHWFAKGGLLFINDMLGLSYGRQPKQEYLYPSDHFGLQACISFENMQ